jgi:polar amino acid transport system substrate-binding protein
VVGTSADVLLWGASDPKTGDLRGFDIDVLNAVAKAIDVPVTYKVITYAQRLPSLKNGDVDLVAHTMTINCPRWQGPANGTVDASAPNAINFSSEYYLAGQRVLVRADSSATSIDQLKDATVCVPAGSTNVGAAQKRGIKHLVQQAEVGDCLVLFQEGEVDAITGDDTVLAGFADQDPFARIVGDAFTQEPYGLGINAEDTQFTKYVNAVLQQMRDDGSLAALTRKWMGAALNGKVPPVPPATYGRNVDKLGRS